MTLFKRNGNSASPVPALFDDFFSRELFNWGNGNFSSTNTTVPAINILENNDQFEIEVAAPGMDKKDFNITLEGTVLTISSVKKHKDEKKTDNYTRKEFSYQSFHRTLELPNDTVDGEKIKASYESGLLHITVPKKEEAKRKAPKMIEIA